MIVHFWPVSAASFLCEYEISEIFQCILYRESHFDKTIFT